MKLSIVTINYNDAVGLAKTLNSVASQIVDCTSHGLLQIEDFQLEHIIVDGGSTDGSVEVVNNYRLSVNGRYEVKWVSEKDRGVYNAMNKGIKMASGEYIQILNAGDILASSDVLAKERGKMEEVRMTDGAYPEIMYGNMIRQRADGIIEGKSGDVPYSLLNYFTGTLNHDCCWIKRSLFDEYGLYDESLKIVSDWKWFLQAIGLGHVKPVYVDIDMTIFDTTGISEKNLALRNQERRQVLEEILPPAILADYDKHAFDMHQMDNLRRHPWAYKLVWTLERILNRLDNKNFKKPKK